MLYSLMSPESGRVLVDGRAVATDPVAARRALGVMPDAPGVYKRLTARENIQYVGEPHGLPRPIVHARTVTLATALQTEDIHDRTPAGCTLAHRTLTAHTPSR